MPDLTLICGRCSQPVEGDAGFLAISLREIRERRSADQAWRERHPGNVHPLRDLLSLPDRISWYVRHDACEDPSEGDCYQIDAARFASWPELARWTADLMTKNWLPLTDWGVLLREAADGNGSRIRRAARVAA